MGWGKPFRKLTKSVKKVVKNIAKGSWDLVSKPVESAFDAFGADKFNPIPSWDELQRPGQAFSNQVKTINSSFLPDSLEAFAVPLEAAAIGFASGNPYAGAAFNTAYNAGDMQANQKGMDWGSIGKDAAINFGTAAVADWAKNATAPKPVSQSGSMLGEGFNAQQAAKMAPPNALSGFSESALADNSANALRSIGYGPVNEFQSSTGGGFGDTFKAAAAKAAPGVANDVLTSTLTPSQATPISGMDTAQSLVSGGTGTNQYGDILKAFGNPNMIIPDGKGGYTIDREAANRGYQAISANDWLQKAMRRDQFIPAGQVRASENTPYERQLSDIGESTQQYYKDFDEQLRQAAMTKALMTSNPWMTQDDVMKYTTDTTQVPETMRPFFQQLKPIFY